MGIVERITKLSPIAISRLEKELNFGNGTIKRWDTSSPSIDKVAILANYLNVSVDYLITGNGLPENSNAMLLDGSKIRHIPIFESVSAGFGAMAENQIVDYAPIYIDSDCEAKNTICIRVSGDSMFPKIEDGDLIQVEKMDSVDSGSIAVLLVDGETAYVKQITYGLGWAELHSFNPMYPVMRFNGSEVSRIRVLGKVKRIIKEV